MSTTWIYFLYQLSFQGSFLYKICTPSALAGVVVENGTLIDLWWVELGHQNFWKRASYDSIVQSRLTTTGSVPPAPADGCYGEIWVEECQMFIFFRKKFKTLIFIINIVNQTRFFKKLCANKIHHICRLLVCARGTYLCVCLSVCVCMPLKGFNMSNGFKVIYSEVHDCLKIHCIINSSFKKSPGIISINVYNT